jgi:4-hydroxy-tetrahydrodipicolinate synthase
LTAAVLIPRLESGTADRKALEENLHSLAASPVQGISIGGATGEYAQQDEAERLGLLRLAGSIARSGGKAFIPAVGAGALRQSLLLARTAADAGAWAVLLPPPLFFRYGQEDLLAYYEEAVRLFPVPVLIYNLPQFVTPVDPPTASTLIGRGVAGIKDSSGHLDILRAYSAMHPRPKRFVGNDSALLEALAGGLCDGAISGVAGVLPELLSAVLGAGAREDAVRIFQELLDETASLPAPWSLKVIAEMRGWGRAEFPFTPSPGSAAEIQRLRAWLQSHRAELLAA